MDETMADDNTTQDSGSFNTDQFLAQVRGEITKSQRDALKSKVKGLLQKRAEAQRAVAVIDEEIEREIQLFQKGLA
jgi:predicted transcriptional regulator